MKETTLKLICLDFDGTIVTNKLNQILTMQEKLPQIAKIECYNSVNDAQEHGYPEGIINLVYNRLHYPQRIKNLIEQLFKQEYAICITSFSQYPQIIKLALRGLELPQELLAQIKVVCGRNINDDYEIIGKQNHIAKAQALCGITQNHNTTLIDDDIRMINIAKKYGCPAITPPKDNNLAPYIEQITNIEPAIMNSKDIPYHNNTITLTKSLLTEKLANRKKLLSLKACKSSADPNEIESPICSETFLSFSSATTLGEERPENITLTDMRIDSCLIGDI